MQTQIKSFFSPGNTPWSHEAKSYIAEKYRYAVRDVNDHSIRVERLKSKFSKDWFTAESASTVIKMSGASALRIIDQLVINGELQEIKVETHKRGRSYEKKYRFI